MTSTLTLPPAPGSPTPFGTARGFQEIVDDLTRRGLIAGGLAAAAVLGLAACGSDDDASASSDGDGAWSFTDDLGQTVDLTRRPRRVVTLADTAMISLYSAGLSPVATPMVEGTDQQLRDLGMAPADVDALITLNPAGNGSGLDLEAVAKAKPDLLVDVVQQGKSILLSQFPELAELAPAVAIDLQTATLDAAMTTVHRLSASLTGGSLADTATQATYDQLAARLRDALAAKPGLRVAFCWSDEKGISVNNEPQWGYMRTLAALGMRFTPIQAAAADYQQTFSWESAADIEADLIVLWNGGVPTSPAWRSMPAVRAGQFLDMSNQWFLVSYQAYADNLTALLPAVESARVVA